MAYSETPLFRAEALAERTDRLSGSVSVAMPTSWQLITYLIFGGIGAVLFFLSIATYSQVEVANGKIEPNRGVVAIVPTRSGIASKVFVRDGQQVPLGAALASVVTEENAVNGSSPTSLVESAIKAQIASLTTQINSVIAQAQAQQQQLSAQRRGLEAEIAQLKMQIALQQDLVASAQLDLNRAKTVAERGFISGRDLQQRADTVLLRQQQMSQLKQSLALKESDLRQNERNADQLAAQILAQTSSIAATRAQADQQSASVVGSRAYALRAPVAGLVTAVTAHAGQAVSPQAPLMMIVPTGSTLQAQLTVPSTAIGFVKPGMRVDLAIDAYPYTQFGTIGGKVLTVASAPASQVESGGSAPSTFLITVELIEKTVSAYGSEERLLPGMTLSARIVTRRQSLLKWLFNPLFAVGKR